tara:strand:+ start:420 stop:680 length:261 start_codon:yes stop_codon:yes gene_type:complete
MLKEFKYIFFILTIILFIFFSGKYYFSDENKKKSFRSIINLEKKIDDFSTSLDTLPSDTDNIIEYVENNANTEKKNFFFWNLLNND